MCIRDSLKGNLITKHPSTKKQKGEFKERDTDLGFNFSLFWNDKRFTIVKTLKDIFFRDQFSYYTDGFLKLFFLQIKLFFIFNN